MTIPVVTLAENETKVSEMKGVKKSPTTTTMFIKA